MPRPPSGQGGSALCPLRPPTSSVPSIRRFEWSWRRLGRLPSWRDVAAEFSWARVATALLIALLLAGVGYGGYLLGRPDVDEEALRAAAIAHGREAGAQRGATQGYEHGYESSRHRSYAPAYAAAYREAYASEFERGDLAPPQRIQVPDPP